MRLSGKTAIITGGGGGIGNAVKDLFLAEGASVATFDIGPAEAEQSPHSLHLTVDISQEEQVSAAVQSVSERLGGVDVLVNCAALMGPNKPAHQVTVEEFDRIMAVNVRGTWLMTKHVIPLMQEAGGGSIIDFSSIAGLVGGTSSHSTYHVTKGAVRLMAKADALAYAADGIRVNSIHPGSTDTPMSRQTAERNPGGAEAHNRRILESHPLGRRASTADIAYGVLYLASDESAFVTGSELVIDGGYSAR